MKIRPYGESAVLVELESRDDRHALEASLRDSPPPQVVEHVPGDRTVLVRTRQSTDLVPLVRRLQEIDLTAGSAQSADTMSDVHEISVTYDGADLDEVARHLGIQSDDVVARHTSQLWTVEFAGFLPGFGYLTGDEGGLEVPRRSSPRTRIPRGAVALAGGYSGVYPSPSPGGWQLIGHTDEPMFDPLRDPAAVLTPGARIRFTDKGSRHGHA